MEVNTNFKPKEKGSPRASRNSEIYEAGLIPFSHLKLFNGIKTALDGEVAGEIVLQRVLDLVRLHRASALKAIRSLVKYGYITYEPKPREHRVFVEILKNKEHDSNENSK